MGHKGSAANRYEILTGKLSTAERYPIDRCCHQFRPTWRLASFQAPPTIDQLSTSREVSRMSCMGPQQARRISRCGRVLCSLLFLAATGTNAYSSDPIWAAKLDDNLRFYQTTEMGVLIAGTEKSLYAVDSETGEVLWRRRNMRVEQTDLAPVVGTDLLLLSYEKSGRSRMEAVDIITGNPLWQSDKVKGSVMHLAVDPEYELVALVLVRDTKGRIREGFQRRPTIHLLSLADGNELWKRELGSEVEMSPSRWSAKEDEDT